MAFLILLGQNVAAQQRGTLSIEKDPRIDSLLALRLLLTKAPRPVVVPHIDAPHTADAGTNVAPVVAAPVVNATTATIAGTAMGYRVQFYMSANRKEVYDAQSRFNQLYPGYRTYIVYNAPNFKVRAGDFRTRLEAQGFLQQLKGKFTGLFIIPDKINLLRTANK